MAWNRSLDWYNTYLSAIFSFMSWLLRSVSKVWTILALSTADCLLSLPSSVYFSVQIIEREVHDKGDEKSTRKE